MALGTAKGPTFLEEPDSRALSAASTMVRVEGPPEPMMMPVRSLETSFGSRPASRIAWSMATWFQAVPPPWKRMARRSTIAGGVERRRAIDLGTEAVLSELFGPRDAGSGFVQAGENFLRRIADRRHDAHAGDDDTSHGDPFLKRRRNRSTLQSKRQKSDPLLKAPATTRADSPCIDRVETKRQPVAAPCRCLMSKRTAIGKSSIRERTLVI